MVKFNFSTIVHWGSVCCLVWGWGTPGVFGGLFARAEGVNCGGERVDKREFINQFHFFIWRLPVILVPR
jgi:hypothetical protein